MPITTMQEILLVFKTTMYFVGFIGILIGFIGFLFGWIYKSDRKQNRAEHINLFKKADATGKAVAKIEGKLKL